MRIETLCTGDELLTGLTSDTNSRFFQEALLARSGLTVRRGLVVGDNQADIVEALKDCARRADVLLVSGGLGPTADDITVDCAAEALGVPLVESAEAWAHIEARFAARQVKLTPNNRRQARVPQGAEVVLNSQGSAPLFIIRLGGCQCFFVPGVPSEYRHLVGTQVLPRLENLARERAALSGVRLLKSLRCINLPESHLDALVQPLMAKHPTVTFGFRTKPPENHLKLLALGASRSDAVEALAAAEADCRRVLEPHVFGVDEETLPEVVGRLLMARGERVAVAESLTGGAVCEQLSTPPGASAWFAGGSATYHDDNKAQWARVPPTLISAHTAVSEQVAYAMAEGIRAAAGAQWGLSLTGVAGPSGGSEEKPVGTVFIGLATPTSTQVARHRLHGDRMRVRRFATMTAIDALRCALEQK